MTLALEIIFLDVTPKHKKTKAKLNKWDYVELKSFYPAKETIKKRKRQPTEQEKICANPVYDKGLISERYKVSLQPSSKKKN